MSGPYTRYVMRTSGEKRFQPLGPSESAAFAALDYLKRKGGKSVLEQVLAGTEEEEEKDRIVQELIDDIGRATLSL